MLNYFRDEIVDLTSYTPTCVPSPDVVKLDAMESPFSPSDAFYTEWLSNISQAKLNRYPDSHTKIYTHIQKLMGMTNDSMILGNGSDELIQLIMLGLKKDTEIISFTPSFVMYEIIAKWCNLPFYALKLKDDYTIDIKTTLSYIDNDKKQALFIAYPNNPTGNAFSKKDLERILQTNTLVIIDEAYYAYASDSFINKVKHYDNLIVLRTISKIGFAGLRLGIMTTNTSFITEFNKLRMPYNINTLTMASVQLLLAYKDEIEHNANIIKKNRTILLEKLHNITILKVYPTDANFILFVMNTANSTTDANHLHRYLTKQHILIKNMTSIISGGLRVTVGTESENNRFIATLNDYIRIEQ